MLARGILILSLTNACGCDCVFCDLPSAPRKAKLSRELILAALENPPHGDIWEEVNLTGGDPLVIPHVLDLLVEVVARRNRFQRLSISSAGVPAAAALRGLQALPEDLDLEIFVSLDGIGETHDFIRGRRGAFEQALRFLEGVGNRPRARTALSCVINRHNVHELDLIADFAAEGRLPISYSLVAESDHYINSRRLYGQVALSDPERQIAMDFLSRRSASVWGEELRAVLDGEPRRTPCRLLNEGFLLTPDGKIAVCGASTTMVLGEVAAGSAREAEKGWRAAAARRGDLLRGGAPEPCIRCTTNCYART